MPIRQTWQYSLHSYKPKDCITHIIPQIVRCAYQRHGLLRGVIHSLGNAEICQFEHSFLIDEYVMGLDVAVDDLVLVQVLQSQCHLDEEVHDEGLFEVLLLLLSALYVDREVAD